MKTYNNMTKDINGSKTSKEFNQEMYLRIQNKRFQHVNLINKLIDYFFKVLNIKNYSKFILKITIIYIKYFR